MSLDSATQKRLIEFAVRVIRLSGALPKSQAGQHVAAQLLQVGTKAAPSYASGNGQIALQSLAETQVWLQIVRQSEMLPEYALNDLMTEGEQLSKLLTVN